MYLRESTAGPTVEDAKQGCPPEDFVQQVEPGASSGNAVQEQAPRVVIYVADHCAVCEYAYEVAEMIRSNFPEVDLSIVNLSHTTEAIPDMVFATPTYLLNGRLWSLGNPSPEDVQARLAQVLDR